MKCVVYKIENEVNGKVYVGSSINFNKRKREHLNDLVKNQHHSIHLQRSYNLHGKENFHFFIIEEVDELIIRERELAWMTKLGALDRDKGYNISESTTNFSASGKNHPMYGRSFKEMGYVSYLKGKTIPEHIRVKMRKPRSEQAKINMRLNKPDIRGDKNPMYGKKFTEEHCKKISDSQKGKKLTTEHREKLKGRTGKLSVVSREVVQLSIDGEYINKFDNITQGANLTSAVRQQISKVCKGERNQTGGYKWMYLDDYEVIS